MVGAESKEMMDRRSFIRQTGLAGGAALVLPSRAWGDTDPGRIAVDPEGLVIYQARPLVHPVGGDAFRGSNFIHPLKTPSGFVITGHQPADHPHHFGLWWPWKHVEIEGRKILCWELQQGDGLIQARENKPISGGVSATSVYIDRKAPNGPREVIHETARIIASPVQQKPVPGYVLDLEIVHRVAVDVPVTVTPYRYSGFAFRGTSFWKRGNSTVLTSEGMDRDGSNFTSARWVLVQGKTDSGGQAGVLLMSHPSNRSHPEKLRTWDKQVGGAVFINFNPVMDESWEFKPGKYYVRRYRLFVYDGQVTSDEAERLWSEYEESRKI